MMLKLKRAAALGFFIFLAPLAVFSFNAEGLGITFGNAIILNGEPAEISPAPGVVTAMLGVTVPMRFSGIFYFEPGVRAYITTVTAAVVDGSSKAVFATEETDNWVKVINLELRPEIGAVFAVSERFLLGITGAPVFSLRFPYRAEDSVTGQDDMSAVSEYYYSSARYLGFYAGGFISWGFGEHTTFRTRVGTNLPVYHLWDGDDAGFHDQLVIEPEIGFVWRF